MSKGNRVRKNRVKSNMWGFLRCGQILISRNGKSRIIDRNEKPELHNKYRKKGENINLSFSKYKVFRNFK